MAMLTKEDKAQLLKLLEDASAEYGNLTLGDLINQKKESLYKINCAYCNKAIDLDGPGFTLDDDIDSVYCSRGCANKELDNHAN